MMKLRVKKKERERREEEKKRRKKKERNKFLFKEVDEILKIKIKKEVKKVNKYYFIKDDFGLVFLFFCFYFYF